jgi:putative glutamine amidotransferase
VRVPVIGVSTSVSWVGAYGPLASRHVSLVTNANIMPIIDFGGIPMLMPNFVPHEHIAALVERLDGILFPGGPDIHPGSYGQEQKVVYAADVQSTGTPYLRPRMMEPDRNRDRFELAVYAEAKRQNKPVLGICRGMQLINVAEGGTLHQEVAELGALEHEIDHSGYNHHHEIVIERGTLLRELVAADTCFAPSAHHQAIDRVGKELIVSGRASDGVAEFIELADRDTFIVGVQGDIERARRNLTYFDNLYRGFVDQCRVGQQKPPAAARKHRVGGR